MTQPNITTPLALALAALRTARALTADEAQALTDAPPVGVRTYGDLMTVVGRGEVKGALGKKLAALFGIADETEAAQERPVE